MARISKRLTVLIVLALLLVVAVALRFLFAGGGSGSSNPAAARIRRYEQQGNLAALAEECSNRDVEAARLAVEALGRSGPKAVPHVARAMQDRRTKIRETAAAAYGRVATRDQAARLARVAQEDDSPNVRATAVTSLGRLRAYNEMEALLAALDDDDLMVRRRANEAVCRIAGVRFAYRAEDPQEQRRQSIVQIRKEWSTMKEWVSRYHESRSKKGQR